MFCIIKNVDDKYSYMYMLNITLLVKNNGILIVLHVCLAHHSNITNNRLMVIAAWIYRWFSQRFVKKKTKKMFSSWITKHIMEIQFCVPFFLFKNVQDGMPCSAYIEYDKRETTEICLHVCIFIITIHCLQIVMKSVFGNIGINKREINNCTYGCTPLWSQLVLY